MKLSKRLLTVASFVKKGSIPADIGTDHAYLPAYLITQGVCERAFASDIGEFPLLNAKETVEKYGLSDKIMLVLSDGLEKIDLDSVDTLIFAGMGGDLICDILSTADENKLRKLRIIAQPQTHIERVRLFLMKNGFETENEKICLDAKHIYICLCAEYTGRTDYPPCYEYYGKLAGSSDALTHEYFEKLLGSLKIKQTALLNNGKATEAEVAAGIINNISIALGEKYES